MIIKKVELKNIKSYSEDIVEFADGVTSIHGANGAGKSTVLESIGYVLFDSLQYNQADFVRKGEKTGEVSITIQGADDLEYTITRKCGSSQAYYLIDSFNNRIEGKEDVGDKLCEILGYKVPEFNQLRSLFENAVGVLQGTFVSEFLESPGRRKSIFDPLLRIDEYNTAHKNLLSLKNMVKDGIDDMDKEIRYLEGRTERLEPLSAEKLSLLQYQSDLKKEEAEKKALLKESQAQKERYDVLESSIRELDTRQKVIAQDIKNKSLTLEHARAELNKAGDACKKLQECETGYKRYLARLTDKETLEKRRSERDALLVKMNAINASAVELKTKLAECDKALKEIARFETDIKALEPLAIEQERLEAEKQRLSSEINARAREALQFNERMRNLKCAKGNLCPILPGVECKSVTDFQSYFNAELTRINIEKTRLEGEMQKTSNQLKALNDPRLLLNVKLEALKKRDTVAHDQEKLSGMLIEKESEQQQILLSLSEYSALESSFRSINDELRSLKPAYEEYQLNVRAANAYAERQRDVSETLKAVEAKNGELLEIGKRIQEAKAAYDVEAHSKVRSACEQLGAALASIAAKIESSASRLKAIESEIAVIDESIKKMGVLKEKRTIEVDYLSFVERAREIIRTAGPEVIRVYIELISREATNMYCEIANDRRIEIKWTQDYDIVLTEDGRERTFKQLSGGEQMSAALAVRLAILKILTSSDVVFLDEPTQNLDENRRNNLAQEIMRIKNFRQMIIISHDDTFNADLENVIEIEKINGASAVRRRNGLVRSQATLQ